MAVAKTLEIHTSPHVQSGTSVDTIMRGVVLSLIPASLFAVFMFGVSALVTLTVAVASCLLFEHLFCRWSDQPSTIGDGSVAITGLLYGLTLPPAMPCWMVVVGAFIAVGLGKYLFGGLGSNPFNPALVGRAFLQAAFPVNITTWAAPVSSVNWRAWTIDFSWERFSTFHTSTYTFPLAQPNYVDAITNATPLARWKFEQATTNWTDLAAGFTSGSAGETCSILLLLGGLYLIYKNYMNWRIPLSIFVTVFVFSGILWLVDASAYPSPFFMLFSGGLMLGALYMATDMVASPMTTLGVVIYGGLIGILTVSIRIWGGMPEGVMYAILFCNAVSPHIDQLIRPRVYGTAKSGGAS